MPNDAATGLAYSESGGNATITGRGTYPAGGTLTIPATVDGYNVVAIGYNAFNGNTMTSVTLPTSGNFTSLGDYAFQFCESLTSISLPNSLTAIETQTFRNCIALTSISLPSTLTRIWDSAFRGSGLTSISLPNSLTEFRGATFYDCTGLRSISLPSNCTLIPAEAFGNCTALTSISLPSTITAINYGAFTNCTALTTITMPNTVTHLGQVAFQNCLGLTSIAISTSLTAILQRAFENCRVLTSITIPASVGYLGEFAFQNCYALASISLPNNFNGFDLYVFRHCRALTSITIPNSVTQLPTDTFLGCLSLTNVTLGSGVAVLGGGAFTNTGLTQITFPSNVTTIALYCFSGSNLTSVTIPSTVISIGELSFGNISTLQSVVFSGGYRSGYAGNMFSGSNNITSITTTDLANWPASYFGGGGKTVTLVITGLPCFAEGTRVLTQNGYKAIEALKNSDLLTTADGRVIDFKLFKTTLRTTTERTAPYLIQPHAFGRNLPSAPIRLSALHKIQLRKGLWTSAEKAVLSNPLVKQCAIGGPVTYYHIECENYLKDDIVTEGLVVESLGTVKSTGGRSDIYTWNSRLGAYTRISHLENGKSSKTL